MPDPQDEWWLTPDAIPDEDSATLKQQRLIQLMVGSGHLPAGANSSAEAAVESKSAASSWISRWKPEWDDCIAESGWDNNEDEDWMNVDGMKF